MKPEKETLMNVYEYTIRDPKAGTYTGSYTIPAGVPQEKEVQKQYKSRLVQTFLHIRRYLK